MLFYLEGLGRPRMIQVTFEQKPEGMKSKPWGDLEEGDSKQQEQK